MTKFFPIIFPGTSVMIGIGTREASLMSDGYLNLIGIDKFSWGLSNKGHLWHDNISRNFCDSFDQTAEQQSDLKIGCLFDGYKGRLAYFKNGQFINLAFTNIPVNLYDLYPMVSSTVAKSIIRIESAYESFPSLSDLCRDKLLRDKKSLSAAQCIPYSFLNWFYNNLTFLFLFFFFFYIFFTFFSFFKLVVFTHKKQNQRNENSTFFGLGHFR